MGVYQKTIIRQHLLMNKPTRRKRNERDSRAPAMIVTERDKQIIQMVYHCRVLRQNQIHSLFFGASKAASQRRLALLYHHGFLTRAFLTVRASYMFSPALYLLDKRGAELLRSEYGYDDITWTPKSNEVGQPFLEHTIAINDVRIAITLACQTSSAYSLSEWRGEAEMKASFDRVTIPTPTGKMENVSLIPDSFFVVQTPKGKAPFFLEVDRGTETTGRFQSKIHAYQAYVQSGGYEKRYGYKSLRVLTTVPSLKRLAGLQEVTEMAGGKERYWFALQAEMLPHHVLATPIWHIAGRIGQAELFSSV